MSPRPPQPSGGRPRIPTWLLVIPVVLALGGAGWLFLAGGDDGDAGRDEDPPAERERRERADGVLEIPDSDEPTDARRRGEEGRNRLDDPDAADEDDDAADEEDLPPVYANLRGRRVAIVSASLVVAGDADRLSPIAGLRLPCAGLADPGRRDVEQAIVGRAAALLRQAGASVVDVVDEEGIAPCVVQRVREQERAEFAVVLRAGDGDATRVLAGRAAPGAAGGTRATALTLARELAATLGVDATTRATGRADQSLLARSGAVDLPDGAAVVLVELESQDAGSTEDVERVARALTDALATHASRADG